MPPQDQTGLKCGFHGILMCYKLKIILKEETFFCYYHTVLFVTKLKESKIKKIFYKKQPNKNQIDFV